MGRASFPSNIYNAKKWNTLCSGLSELPKCIQTIDLPTCEDVSRTEIMQAAEIFLASEWEHLGFHCTTGTCKASPQSALRWTTSHSNSRVQDAPIPHDKVTDILNPRCQ
ncbi:hypothetical protein CAPTEDRAFT_218013 [Capitella teleta]|uniref:Uncharacterized protein n=1 Tax=Capitella teleta TaxID=283909 RepID=R7TBC0_CAPTE|nr:hypothetical protein CAPTEDRAFT_218013 [Capitella teleta]|eukprot:ELT88767.1 hypothetical protein CAPTEDRAFT_218013 [Capitella teleta]